MTIKWGKQPPKELVVHTGRSRRKVKVDCGSCTQEEGFCWHQCRKKYKGSLAQRKAAIDFFAPLDDKKE